MFLYFLLSIRLLYARLPVCNDLNNVSFACCFLVTTTISGVARGTWVHAPRRSWNFFQNIIRLWICTRFVMIYGFVKFVQHVSPAFGGFAPDPHRDSAPGHRWGLPSPRAPFCPRSKLLDTPLTTIILMWRRLLRSCCRWGRQPSGRASAIVTGTSAISYRLITGTRDKSSRTL